MFLLKLLKMNEKQWLLFWRMRAQTLYFIEPSSKQHGKAWANT
jgi:hypothetical protein